jgi:hypothetical protein
LAADVILSRPGRYGADDLEAYAQRVRQRFGRPRARGAADWLPPSWLQAVASRLLAAPWFARRIVMERWFLHTTEPSLKLRHFAQLTTQIPGRYDTSQGHVDHGRRLERSAGPSERSHQPIDQGRGVP